MPGRDKVEALFTYHPPTEDQITRMQQLRVAARAYANLIEENCPASHERIRAIELLHMASMVANAAIAVNE